MFTKYFAVDASKYPMRTQRLTRSEVRTICRQFETVPYWDGVVKEGESDSREFDEYELASSSGLLDRQVRSADNMESIGRITDLSFDTRTGELVYLVLTSSENEHRAIPLGAFDGKADSSTWMVDLPSKLIFQFKPFSPTNPPRFIDRGWTEFVAIKYGRNGLQQPR